MKEEMQNNTFEEGRILLINKPLEWTSFDVVKRIRNIIRVKKVGHAGTLDPLATGLLIVCTGKFTKQISEFMSLPKEYTGTITLGANTPTFDLESEPQNFQSTEGITESKLHAAAIKFTGEQMQMPPIHSAIKQKGKPVYLKARKGEEVIMEPRKIKIEKFEITRIELPELDFKIKCSTGTYIRSIANDFGKELGCGGYLSRLCRTRIGDFHLDKAMTMKDFVEVFKSGNFS